jgi:hypothetical protein
MAELHLSPGRYTPMQKPLEQEKTVTCELVDSLRVNVLLVVVGRKYERKQTEMRFSLALSPSLWLMIGHTTLIVRP